ncbi:MAG TPA: hypothetical protein VEX62_06475 [Candidatus Limnocylindrales bacterium]|nr:hypothetical protein [Candidatus Limnocylindrales bacterium]
MHRPIGVTLLAIGAAVAGLFQVWRILVFLGIAKFNFIGNEVAFSQPQWGQAFWAFIMAAIWFYVAAGFWGMRGYAWSFGIFIALFTMIFGFFAILGGSATTESELVGWALSIAIFFYLNYPGVRDQFINAEMSRLTPEQRVAVENAARANAAAAQAMAAPAAVPAAAAVPPTDPTKPAG